MARRHKPEEVIGKLREAEIGHANLADHAVSKARP